MKQTPLFSLDTYVQRRRTLMAAVGQGKILLLGNDESARNFAHNTYSFRQDSTFLYYLGIALPGLVAVLDCDAGTTTLYGTDITMDDVVWTGPQPGLAELAGTIGAQFAPKQDLLALMGGQEWHAWHSLPAYRPEHKDLFHQITGSAQLAPSENLIKAVVAQRSIKSEDELLHIEQAVNVTGRVHRAVMAAAKPGMVERELVALIHDILMKEGCEASFPPIVTRDGHILHNQYYENTLAKGDLVLCDAGAEVPMGYAGDMTRTFALGGFNSRQKDLYNIVLGAHEAAIAALRPGVPFFDVHVLACKTLVEGLIELDIMQGNADDAVQAGAHTLFFQCGLGHMMGLDVHDMENLGEAFVGYTPQRQQSTKFGFKSLRLGRELEPGFVITVEPGLYFIPALFDQWKSKRHLESFINYDVAATYMDAGGIRVEDDFVITSDGARLLGEPVPRTIDDIEALQS